MSLHLPALSGFQAEGWNVTSLCSPQQPPQSVHMLLLRQPVLLCFPGSGQEVSLKKGIPQAYIRARTWGGGRGGNATQCEGAKMTMWRGKAAGPDWPDSNYTQSRYYTVCLASNPHVYFTYPFLKCCEMWAKTLLPVVKHPKHCGLRGEQRIVPPRSPYLLCASSPVCLVFYVKRHVCPGEVLWRLINNSAAFDTSKDTGRVMVLSTANPPPLWDEVMSAGLVMLHSSPTVTGFKRYRLVSSRWR